MAEPSKSSNSSEPVTVRLFGRTVTIPRGWWLNPLVMIPLLVGIAYLLLMFFGDNGIYHSMALKRQVAAGQAHLDSIQARNDELRERVKRLKENNPVALEEEARLMGMVKQGERVYILQPDTAQKKVGKTK